LEGFVGAEMGFDDWDDFGRGWVWARDADLAPVAEGFEVRDGAGGIEGVEFLDGFWEWDVKCVDEFHSVPFDGECAEVSAARAQRRALFVFG
jgi:hypothetical protein